MFRRVRTAVVIAVGVVLGIVSGCERSPEPREDEASLVQRARSTVDLMKAQDRLVTRALDGAAGYAVFPSVAKGGAVVGAAYGRGVVFAGGEPVGYAELTQASLGAQLGGKTFAELIVFRTPFALEAFKRDESYTISGELSAIVLNTSASARPEPTEDVSIFIYPRGGLMFDMSIVGQRIDYEPFTRNPERR